MRSALALVFLLIPATLLAQQADTLRRGLLVGYNGNLSFGTFNGASVSLKTEKSATRAVRLGVGFNLSGLNGDNDHTTERVNIPQPGFEHTSINTGSRTHDEYAVYLDVAIEVEQYRAVSGRMRPYVLYGAFAGPSFTLSAIDQKDEHNGESVYPEQPPAVTSSEELRSEEAKRYAWRGGLLGGLGVEWRLADDLSLLAEYRTTLSYARVLQKQKITRASEDPIDSSSSTEKVTTRNVFHDYGLNSGGLRVGAVLYF